MELGAHHNPQDWRLFIDSSKTSLKAVLLHNNKSVIILNHKLPLVPLANGVEMKETYESMALPLGTIKYRHHE